MNLVIKGNEMSITTADTVNNSRLVKITVTTGNPVLTLAYANAVQIGNTTLSVGDYFVEKNTTDTIAASSAVLATPVGYTSS